jgi:hypothetical protein
MQPDGTWLETVGSIRENGKLPTGCCSQHPGNPFFALYINRKALREGVIAMAQTR